MIAVWAAVLILGTIAFCAWVLGNRVIAPIPAFAGTWATALAIYALSGTAFAPLDALDERTVFFFVTGALLFTSGCLAGHLVASRRAQPPVERYRMRGWAVAVTLAGMVVAVPLAYVYLRTRLAGVPLTQLIYLARFLDVSASVTGGPSILGPFANLVPFAIAAALLLYAVPVESRRQAVVRGLVFFAAAVVPVLTGGRSATVSVILSLVALLGLRGQLRAGRVAGIGLLFCILFFGVALLVGKSGASLQASAGDNARALAQNLRDYTVGGLVAFQRILLRPGEVPSTMGVGRTIGELLNHFGAAIAIPSLHAEYTMIGDRVNTNVYTVYFSYMDYGLLGAAALVVALGVVVSVVYARAQAGYAVARAVYATFFAAMVLSVFNEGFYSNVNFLAKLLLLSVVLLKRVDPRMAHVGEGAGRQPVL